METEKGGEGEPKSERPFFDIGPEAPSSQDRAALTSIGAPAPGPIQVGDLGGAVSVATPTSALSGEVASFNGMFQLQPTLDEPKQAFRWGQYFLGMFAPYLVFFLLITVAEITDGAGEEMPDFFRTEEATLVPDNDGWYNSTVVWYPQESVYFHVDLNATEPEYRGVSMDYWAGGDDWEGNGFVFKNSYDASNGDFSEVEVGEFTPSNQTIWFKLDGSDIKTYDVTFFFHDRVAEEAWWDEHGGPEEIFGFILFCGMPVAFVGSTVAAFVRGNKSLGFGLLSSIPAGLIMLPVMAVLALVLFGL
jgi:hypothetical protein